MSGTHKTLSSIDVAAYYIFAIELLIVFSVSPSLKAFLTSPYTYLDLLGLLPYFIALGVERLEDHRILEFLFFLVPSTRLLKVTRTSAGWSVLMITVRRACKPMFVPMLFLLFLLVFFSCALYFVEAEFIAEYHSSGADRPLKSWFVLRAEKPKTADIPVSPTFANIPEALYFAGIVATTVGLGDLSCKTAIGRVLTVVLAISSVLYIALPIATFGSTFVDVWKDRERLLTIEKIKTRVRSYKNIQIAELQDLFSFCDRDGSGVIDVEEFQHLVNTEFRLDMPEYLVVRLFRAIGPSNTGTVDFRQFCDFFFPHVVLKEDLVKACVPYKRTSSRWEPTSTRRLDGLKESQVALIDLAEPTSAALREEQTDPQETVAFLLQTLTRMQTELRTVTSTCRALQRTLQ